MRKRLNDILEILDSGETHIDTICEHLGLSVSTVRRCLITLIADEKVVSVRGKGMYDLHKNYRPLTPIEQRKIVKDLILLQKDTLTIYRRELNKLLDQEEPDPAETQRILDCIRILSTAIDKLMKRWNLLVQGYDTNTRQAVEDAKEKTSEKEKKAREALPPEDQLEVVGDYDVEMQKLLDKLPEPIPKEATV